MIQSMFWDWFFNEFLVLIGILALGVFLGVLSFLIYL